MRSGHCRHVVVLLALALVPPVPAGAARQGYPDLKPFPGARVVQRSVKELEAYWIPLGRLTGDGQAEKFQVVEGRWTHVTYSNPAKSSVIEIGRALDEQLREAGFEIVYDCRDGNCGQGGRKTNGDWWDPNDQRRYLVGRLTRAEGDVWACVHVHARGQTQPGQHDMDVIEAKPEPRSEPVARDEASAAWIESELNQNGHVALYGIAFDPKRSIVLAASEPTLRALTDLLSRDPQRKILLVVHTDDLAHWKSGLQTSRKQAAALVGVMVRHFGISAARVAGEGVGPLAPTSSRADPRGAWTPRVEIVSLEPRAETLGATGNSE